MPLGGSDTGKYWNGFVRGERMAKAKKQVSFEDALWSSCDKLRGTVEPAAVCYVDTHTGAQILYIARRCIF